ncbi:MAG: c-type cytochrome [Gemmatimonadaceae bacterium]
MPAAPGGAPAGSGGRVAFRVPNESEVADTAFLRAVRRGRALMQATRESLPAHVGNALRCVSCHMGEGLRPDAMPWVGVYGQFPQYRSRSGKVIELEDRINDCFERSMNGRALARDGRDMVDIVAYMAFLSYGIPVGAEVAGQGIPRLDPLPADTVRGAQVYAANCVTCHGASGEGTVAAPPVWGPRSYNIGAGMARVRTAAAFIKQAMPFDRPGSLTPQQAFDVAAYINSRPRPDHRGKEQDWPHGDPPPDVAYPTDAVKRKGR